MTFNLKYASEGTWWDSLFMDGPETQLVTGELCTSWEIFLATCGNGHSWHIPAIYVTFCFLIVSYSLAYFVRRTHYEVFYYAHFVFVPLFVIAYYHSWHLWHYASVGLFLWLFNRAVSAQIVAQSIEIADCEVLPDAVKLVLTKRDGTALKFTPGQWVLLNIPVLDTLDWHPFTVASAPVELTKGYGENAQTLAHTPAWTHYIRNMGSGTWTDRLHRLVAMDKKEMKFTEIRFDGPFGCPPSLAFSTDTEVAVFVAGGIGITPIRAVVMDLYTRLKQDPQAAGSLKAVHVVWAVRSISILQVWSEEILQIQADNDSLGGLFHFDIFLSNSKAQQVTEDTGIEEPTTYGATAANERKITISDTIHSSDVKRRTSSVSVPLLEGSNSSGAVVMGTTRLHVMKQRVRVPDFFLALGQDYTDVSKYTVFGCGPARLLADVSRACFDLEHSVQGPTVHYHEEVFLF
jgi:NAD(P)H-flavin reductase